MTPEDAILNKITRKEVVELLQEYVRTPSISGNERELAEKILKKCNEINLDAKIDRHGNVIARYKWGKGGPKIVLNAHMDTVGVGEGWTKDPFGAVIEGDYLYGRGACDDKGSIVAQLMGVKALIDSKLDLNLNGEIILTFVVNEEVQNVESKGTVKLIKDGLKADMAINGEPTNLEVHLGCKGMVELTITTFGKRAHGGVPEEGINAIVQMCKLIPELLKIPPKYNKYLGYSTIVPGVIRGGERSSVVPEICELKVSRFIVPGESGKSFYDEVKQIIQILKQQDPTFNAKVELTYDSKPAIISEKEPIVQYLIKACKRVYSTRSVKIGGSLAHNDADFLVNMAGIPTVQYGPGDMKVAHTPDEYIKISDVVTASKVYALTLYYALGGEKT